MITFTSSLPDDLLQSLNTLAGKLSIPKNKIIEKALRIYIDQINRAEYVQSFKNAADDIDVLDMAEEGMEDYFKQLD